jgi:hypothetical protein
VDIASFGEVDLLASRRGRTACHRQFPAAASARGTAPPLRSRWPKRRAPAPARWHCADPWCRRTPFRPAPNAAASRILAWTRPALPIPASVAASSVTATRLPSPVRPRRHHHHRRLPLPAKRGRLARGERRFGRHHRRPPRRPFRSAPGRQRAGPECDRYGIAGKRCQSADWPGRSARVSQQMPRNLPLSLTGR